MIIFLLGPAMSGKTYIRKEIFEDCKYIDILDYQEKCKEKMGNNYEALKKAEEEMLKDLIKMVKSKEKDEVIVLEHMLSNKTRRKKYIKAVKKVTDEEIICLFVEPNEEDMAKFIELRIKENVKKISKKELNSLIKDKIFENRAWYHSFGTPSKEDGFDHVLKVVPIYQEEKSNG